MDKCSYFVRTVEKCENVTNSYFVLAYELGIRRIN